MCRVQVTSTLSASLIWIIQSNFLHLFEQALGFACVPPASSPILSYAPSDFFRLFKGKRFRIQRHPLLLPQLSTPHRYSTQKYELSVQWLQARCDTISPASVVD